MRKSHVYLIALVAFLLCSCGTSQQVSYTPPQPKTVNLTLLKNARSNMFLAMNYGIRLSITDDRANTNILRKYDASATYMPQVNVAPEVRAFVDESMRLYMRTMGFSLNADAGTDYIMQVSITDFNVSYLSGTGWSGTVRMNVEVYDQNRDLVYPNVPVAGRANIVGLSNDWDLASVAINTAYNNALEDIDWDRIAFFLSSSHTSKKNDDSVLEMSVIRWYITSAPQGADVYWRVVSSTPEVKNTNQNFLGSTPYESTETLDIKGLNKNNLGNVQIEISCEKSGYVTQKKRFNLQQVIDQKEVSTKMNLVKEE